MLSHYLKCDTRQKLNNSKNKKINIRCSAKVHVMYIYFYIVLYIQTEQITDTAMGLYKHLISRIKKILKMYITLFSAKYSSLLMHFLYTRNQPRISNRWDFLGKQHCNERQVYLSLLTDLLPSTSCKDWGNILSSKK